MYRWMPTVIAALALNSIATTSALTATTTLTERCTFVLGDNDTKNEARELAFVQCKRKLLEKAGSYIQSQVQVTDGRLTKEQISIYAAAILSVEVSSEKFSFRGESMVLEQTIRATVDLDDVRTRLAVIAGDRSVQAKIGEQQKQLRSLEGEVSDLRKELGSATTARAKAIRKRQNVVIDRMDELANLRLAIVMKISASSMRAESMVEVGMTMDEVKQLAGKPRAVSDGHHNYGKIWVVFEHGLVACIVNNYRSYTCNQFRSYHPEEMVK